MLGFSPLASVALADDIGFASYDLVVDAGSLSLSGQDVNFGKGQTLSAGQGSFSLTDQEAGLLIGRSLAADSGSYSLTGQGNGLVFDAKVVAERGTYLTAEQAANFALVKASDIGIFSLTGFDSVIRI